MISQNCGARSGVSQTEGGVKIGSFTKMTKTSGSGIYIP